MPETMPPSLPPATARKPVRVPVFVVSAFLWMGVLIGAWLFVKPWTSYPVGALAGATLQITAPMWIRDTQMVGRDDPHALAEPGHLEVDTRIDVPVPNSGGRRAEIVLEADPSRYAYGLPIFLALLLAARQRHLLRKAVLGYLALIPFQAFTVVFYILKEIAVATQMNLAQLRISAWQVEGIVYGFQLGTLIVPTLVPIIIWLWLDRDFFRNVIARNFIPTKPVAQPAR